MFVRCECLFVYCPTYNTFAQRARASMTDYGTFAHQQSGKLDTYAVVV